MFGGKFSLSKFSLRGDAELNARIDVFYSEAVRSLISGGQNSLADANFRENTGESLLLTRGYKFENTFREQMQNATSLNVDFRFLLSVNEIVNSEINIFADYTIALELAEQVNLSALEGVLNFRLHQDFRDEIDNQTVGGNNFEFDLDVICNVDSTVLAVMYTLVNMNALELIRSDIFGSNDVSVNIPYDETLTAIVHLGGNFAFKQNFTAAVNELSNLSSNTQLIHGYKEAVFMSSSVDLTAEESFTVNVTIPRGAELRIDSDNFIVTLDGVSILHLHTGDFINISRGSLELMVDSGNPLSGELVYTERYL